MKIKHLPPQDYLRSILSYNPITGIFTWKYRSNLCSRENARWAGKTAGSIVKKSIVITIDNIPYQAHRLAYAYMYGNILDNIDLIDHIDCNPFNNVISNLRIATHGENCSNSRGWKKKSLPKGVSYQTHSNKYRSRIGVGKQVIHLGTFATIEEAHACYVKAAVKYKNVFARAA